MFRSFTKYLGSLIGVENSSSIKGVENNSSIPVIPQYVEIEDDWLIVNALTIRKPFGKQDEEDEKDEEDEDEDEDVPPLERPSSASSLQSDSVMEESWFVTPPPCFTSEGPTLSTSPLENLLIEHPSMSVYHINSSSRKYSVSDLRSDDLDDDDDEDFENMGHIQSLSSNWQRLDNCYGRFIMFDRSEGEYGDEEAEFIDNIENMPAYNTLVLENCVEEYVGCDGSDKLEKEVEVVENSAHLPAQTHSGRFLDNYIRILKQEQIQRYQFRQAQKSKVQISTKALRRSYVERNNKAREVNNRNHQQRRGERSQGATRSCANNNRKC
nr:uncharacterized protein LOC111511908 isoform X2 [Leptinotarsa decemlineata]